MKKRNFLKIIMIAVIAVTACFSLMACNPDNKKTDERQYVDIIVKHPVTGEILKDYGWMEFPYDENFVMPDISLKLRNKDVYLSDKDFDNGSLLSHMMLLIEKKGTYMEQPSFENDWPKKAGLYELKIKFNEDGWVGEKSINDKKYFASDIHITLKITQE